MNRVPPVRLPVAPLILGAALGTTILLVASGCAYQETAPPRPYLTSAPAARPSPPKPSASPAAPATTPALTDAQAQAALVTDADLGEPWTPTQGAATWRDGFLKATATAPDCHRLLDALYADDLLGSPARAAIGLDDEYDDAQLRYRISTRPPADVDRALAWLKGLPRTCGTFKAVGPRREPVMVTVADAPLPEAGDARQGLRVTLTRGGEGDEGEGGEPVTLTLDVAAVRVGDDALTVTNGGLGEILDDSTWAAVELGAERLTQVRKQGRVQV
ncbi:hypothetical protein ACFRI7_05935 [Streptomyces sp. NPDC056716]|uniref:hypothetical protein n=1 Tax=unclassified Streptomyces TaxID=2593676 RepID=UPI0036AD014A